MECKARGGCKETNTFCRESAIDFIDWERENKKCDENKCEPANKYFTEDSQTSKLLRDVQDGNGEDDELEKLLRSVNENGEDEELVQPPIFRGLEKRL